MLEDKVGCPLQPTVELPDHLRYVQLEADWYPRVVCVKPILGRIINRDDVQTILLKWEEVILTGEVERVCRILDEIQVHLNYAQGMKRLAVQRRCQKLLDAEDEESGNECE